VDTSFIRQQDSLLNLVSWNDNNHIRRGEAIQEIPTALGSPALGLVKINVDVAVSKISDRAAVVAIA
jgi:hypothetical protein